MIRLKGSINYINILLKNRKGRVGEAPSPSLRKKGRRRMCSLIFFPSSWKFIWWLLSNEGHSVLNSMKQTAKALGGKCDTTFLLLLVEETHLLPSLDVAAYCRHIFYRGTMIFAFLIICQHLTSAIPPNEWAELGSHFFPLSKLPNFNRGGFPGSL